MAQNFKPAVYRTSGGDQQVIASSGRMLIEAGGELDFVTGSRLEIAGTPFITSGGNIALGSLTSGNINTTGSVIATSGITGSSGTFTGHISASSGTFTGGLALTSGISASTGGFSSGASFGAGVTFTSGIQATTGNFSGGAAVSSDFSVGAHATFTSGFAATTGNFSGGAAVSSALSVANTFTMTSGLVRPFQQFATGAANPATMNGYGVSEIWSSGSDSTAGRKFALAAPAAGVEKWIYCIASTLLAPAYVTTTGAAALIDGAIGSLIFSSGATNRQWAYLMGQNTTNWMLLARSTDILTSTT